MLNNFFDIMRNPCCIDSCFGKDTTIYFGDHIIAVPRRQLLPCTTRSNFSGCCFRSASGGAEFCVTVRIVSVVCGWRRRRRRRRWLSWLLKRDGIARRADHPVCNPIPDRWRQFATVHRHSSCHLFVSAFSPRCFRRLERISRPRTR